MLLELMMGAGCHDIFYFGKQNRKHIDGGYLEWTVNTFSSPCLTVKRQKSNKHQLTKNHVHYLLSDLKSCSRKKDLQAGRQVHANALETGNASNIFVAAGLINMYAKCGSMVDARRVFESIDEPDIVSWTALILGYADNREGQTALDIFIRMKTARRCAPNSVTYVAIFKACTSLAAYGDESGKEECLRRARKIHSEIGRHMDHFVQSTLINMYASFGSMTDARRVFETIKEPNVVSWTALILGYAKNGEGQTALVFFSRMKSTKGCAPNCMTYVAAIKACASVAEDGDIVVKAECLKQGREIESEIGHHMDQFLQSTLINMYAKCGSMVDAHRVFDSIEKPDMVSHTTVILGYAENGDGQSALDFFSRTKLACGYVPDFVLFVAAIKACASLAEHGDEARKVECLKRGRELHSEIGRHMNPFLQSTLINMYAKCGSIVEAREVFDSIAEPTVVTCNALILGYTDNGEGRPALEIFSGMKAAQGCIPNTVTYIAAIKACTSLAEGSGKGVYLKWGREIHLEIGNNMDHLLKSTLINMYAKFGNMSDAQRVFDSIEEPLLVSWTALILGYAENGEGQVGLELFSRMKKSGGFAPNFMIYVAALRACASIGALAIGRKVHKEIIDFDVHVVTSLVDFYAKCGSMIEAREVFDWHSKARNIATWTALLAGYGRFGDSDSVFILFQALQEQGFRPDAVTFVCILLCCSHAGLVEKATEYFEAMPLQFGVTPTVMHYNCMVDVLGRAKQLDEAVTLLQRMPCSSNAMTWMALLGACRKWKNVEIGRVAFKSLQALDEKNTAAYVLMGQIYAGRYMWGEQEKLFKIMRKFGAWKLLEKAYVMDGLGRTVKFVAGEEEDPQVAIKLKEFIESVKGHSYNAESSSIVTNAEEGAPCGHNELRAVVYGILKTPLGEPIRAFKNMRMCGNCHWITKIFSKHFYRVIIVRDESRFHVMENGNCSCREYW